MRRIGAAPTTMIAGMVLSMAHDHDSKTPVTPEERRAHAETMRQRTVQQAAEIGITETFLHELVDRFYARIRQDDVLGPVFENAIGDDWEPHLATMKKFWTSVELMAGTYSGKPMVAHAKVEGLEQPMFKRWLELFQTTLMDISPTAAATNKLMERASRIAQSLELGLFYQPR